MEYVHLFRATVLLTNVSEFSFVLAHRCNITNDALNIMFRSLIVDRLLLIVQGCTVFLGNV